MYVSSIPRCHINLYHVTKLLLLVEVYIRMKIEVSYIQAYKRQISKHYDLRY